MQRTTMIAIAAALGLGLGVGASFISTRSPANLSSGESTVVADADLSTSSSSSDQQIDESKTEGDREPSSLENRTSRSDNHTVQADDVNAAPKPVALTFDAQATHCPKDGGGGPLMGLYMTDTHLIYVCQGGEGRDDWRQLDYYAVKRTQPDEWIRLRAYITSGPGFYAENGNYRYEIDPTSLTVLEGDSVLSQEPVRRCKGDCS
ncbi:MAG: hypothetical protein IGR76_06690 [Synechococcales cyanobacterium T60_A2020_003]|nr:hypothetical protein [Synechococcales cyanobacterium T60_A2020_003]